MGDVERGILVVPRDRKNRRNGSPARGTRGNALKSKRCVESPGSGIQA